jgi:hypothetical protein
MASTRPSTSLAAEELAKKNTSNFRHYSTILPSAPAIAKVTSLAWSPNGYALSFFVAFSILSFAPPGENAVYSHECSYLCMNLYSVNNPRVWGNFDAVYFFNKLIIFRNFIKDSGLLVYSN